MLKMIPVTTLHVSAWWATVVLTKTMLYSPVHSQMATQCYV